MNKSPEQWAKTFDRVLDSSDDMVVNISLNKDQIKEISLMLDYLSSLSDIDKLKTFIESQE